jgi:2-methylcitrate dehydratase PrpD
VRLAAFEPARMNDAATRALMKKIALTLDPELDAAFPGQRAARVEIRLRDGRVLSWLQPFRKGDPEAPLSDSELEQKYRELADPVLGSEAAGALLEKLYRLDELPGLETL